MSTEQKHRILRSISKEARLVKDLTHKTPGGHADAQVHPTILRRWIGELEEAGHLIHHDDDRIEITEAGLMEVNCPTSIASTRYHHFASQPPLVVKPWIPPRANCDQHKQYKSL
jgi:hypothetical protein